MSKDLGCTLSNEELIKKGQEWIQRLIDSGGRDWAIRVPAEPNHDPDLIFSELCNRLQSGEQGMRWVKASKITFEEGIQYFYKIPNNGAKGNCRWDEDEKVLRYFVYGNWESFGDYPFDNILILDEQSPAQQGGQDGWISVDERLPTEKDGDSKGYVFAHLRNDRQNGWPNRMGQAKWDRVKKTIHE
jgi:hypothetical protein